ncbi:uncharacterized protein LOC128610548 isoform X2 [Ictalurus furcatus]|uniref:uncharacterized protein LOC128610548 isoform X2 n=1 Tax=Ictalurus furcatus TaxID=66913 RepID=UPI0023502FDA|nr:uncharacterized protein LOC128610548 isoform X2 [Ictalurus furcatus]
MQHLCFTLYGLLASCLCCWGSSDGFFVSQSPSTVTLRRRRPVQITCSWNISISGVKVTWFKGNQKVEFKQTDKFTETNNNNTSSTLVIKNTDINDAGFYICQVVQDIPRLVAVNGTGTNVTYEREYVSGTSTTQCGTSTTRPITELQNTPQQPVTLLVATLSSAVVFLSICVCLSVWRMKRGCKQSERMVIREGPPSEGTEPENSEVGGSSRTSRGSTQWYMVPVYESYFDLQRSDKEECADSDNTACASALK